MPQYEALTLRALEQADIPAVRRILDTSEYTHYRFTSDELPGLMGRLPNAGALSAPSGRLTRVTRGSLRAFLLVNWLVPPSAWIGGFGVTWSDGAHFPDFLAALLPPLARQAHNAGAETLYYSGSDLESDWLRETFERQGFTLATLLRSYDKEDFAVPLPGNQRVRLRPFTPADTPAVVALENLTFDQLWRHDAASFIEVAATYPYFVVAEDERGIAAISSTRWTRPPAISCVSRCIRALAGMGVGTRLMAEAVRYFERRRVWKIVLNTEETNTRAHALYERFGFHRVPPRGYVLAHDTASLAMR